MTHALRRLLRLHVAGTIPGLMTGALTCAVSLTGVLWLSVALPNLPLVRGLSGNRDAAVQISLESTLLGIDDGSGVGSTAAAQAAARALGLSAPSLGLPSAAALQTFAGSPSALAAAPLDAQLRVLDASQVVAPVAQAPAAPETSPSSQPAPAASPSADPPVAEPVAQHERAPLPVAVHPPDPPRPALPPARPVVSTPASAPSSTPPSTPPLPATKPAPAPVESAGGAHDSAQSADAGPESDSGSAQDGGATPADVTPPAIAAHAALTVEAGGPSGATVAYASPTAMDAVDGHVPVSCAPASGGVFALGATTVSCTAADAAGNASHSSFQVVVHDTTAPLLAAHAGLTVEATSASGAIVSYTSPAASDAVDASVAASCAPASGSVFALGATTVACAATDAAGNASHSSFQVVVHDTNAPSIAAHADLTAEATGATGANVVYTAPAATDAVDTSVTVSCAPASGSHFAFGATTINCSAGDIAGNTVHSLFQVIVHDTTAPSLAAHADLTAEATGAGGATVAYAAPTAADAVDASVAVSCAPASGTVFALGATTVDCSAGDAAGNTGHASFQVVVHDTTAPSLAAHADLSAEATGGNGATVSYTTPAATDAVDANVAVSCAPASGSVFVLGTTTVTCTGTDAGGNAGHSSFQVVVHDTTAPSIPQPADVAVIGPPSTSVSFTITAADAVDGAIAAACSPASGTGFATGSTAVTCTATDHAGNHSSVSFNVVVHGSADTLANLTGTISGMSLGTFGQVLLAGAATVQNQVQQGQMAAAAQTLDAGAKLVLGGLVDSAPLLTVAQARQLFDAGNAVQQAIGTTVAGRAAAETAVFDLLDSVNGLGLTSALGNQLRGAAVNAGNSMIDGNAAAACTSLQVDLADLASQNLSQSNLAAFDPVLAAAESAFGC